MDAHECGEIGKENKEKTKRRFESGNDDVVVPAHFVCNSAGVGAPAFGFFLEAVHGRQVATSRESRADFSRGIVLRRDEDLSAAALGFNRVSGSRGAVGRQRRDGGRGS